MRVNGLFGRCTDRGAHRMIYLGLGGFNIKKINCLIFYVICFTVFRENKAKITNLINFRILALK